jgi:hypothetical protein
MAVRQLRAPRQRARLLLANSFLCSDRSSLLKTARPFRSDPHCCGRGVVVSGPWPASTRYSWFLLLLIRNSGLPCSFTSAPVDVPELIALLDQEGSLVCTFGKSVRTRSVPFMRIQRDRHIRFSTVNHSYDKGQTANSPHR